jgi:hypothetical protein
MSSSSRASSVRVGPRIVAVSAAVGVLLALAIVGVVEASARRAASRARAPAAVAPQPVSVVKRVVPVEAVVTVDGRPWSESLLVVPGASVVVEVSATAHVSERLTLTPVAGAPLVVQATLAPLAAPAPPALPDAGAPDPAAAGSVASVVVDDAPPASGASKPSPPPSSPSPSPPAPAAASGSAAPAKDRPAPSRPVAAPTRPSALVGSPTGGARPGAFAAVKGEGTLVVKASPYWGQVSVDGRALDEQTPVTVKLPPGRHDVVVSHPPRGLVKRFKVVIVSGQTVVRAVTFD